MLELWFLFTIIFLMGLALFLGGLLKYNKKEHNKKDDASGYDFTTDAIVWIIKLLPWWIGKVLVMLFGLLLMFLSIYGLFFAPK
jgi:uncharacterized membrane protein